MPNNTPPAVEKANATRPITITSIVLVARNVLPSAVAPTVVPSIIVTILQREF